VNMTHVVKIGEELILKVCQCSGVHPGGQVADVI